LNGLFSVFLSFGYIINAPSGLYGIAYWSLPMAVISQAFFLNLIPAVISLGLYRFIKWRLPARIVAGGMYCLLQIFVVADLVIFRLFQRHFDGMIWSVITAEGAGDSIRLGVSNDLVICGLVLLLVAIGGSFSLWLAPRLSTQRQRLSFVFGCVLVAVVWERSVYAITDLKDHTLIYWVQERLPYYQPLTIKRLCGRLGIKIATPVALPQPNSGSLRFPKTPIGFAKTSRHPNILFIFVDCARRDALSPDVMPNVWKWKDEACWLKNHYSSGNATAEGIFGALYGIPGTYFPRAIVESKTPPLLDALSSLNYEFRILSCADLAFPPLRQTAFLKWTNQITDHWNCLRAERDQAMTDVFLDFLKSREDGHDTNARPFFGFVFYDAAHQPYYCLPEYRMNPADGPEPEINYALYATSPEESKEIRKYYNNGLHYADYEIGRIIRQLKEEKLYENTIIIVAGDHGEEFGECGHFGHLSVFDPYQTRPLALVRFPGAKTEVMNQLTSHLDFVPSILTWMGATNPISDYSTGRALHQENGRTFVLCTGRDRYALIKTNSVTAYDRYIAQYFDSEFRAIEPGDPRRPTAPEILAAGTEMNVFFK
jgi:hypothetical protein